MSSNKFIKSVFIIYHNNDQKLLNFKIENSIVGSAILMAVSSFVVQRKEIFDVLCCTNDAKFSGRKKGPHGLPFYFKTRWLLLILCGWFDNSWYKDSKV